MKSVKYAVLLALPLATCSAYGVTSEQCQSIVDAVHSVNNIKYDSKTKDKLKRIEAENQSVSSEGIRKIYKTVTPAKVNVLSEKLYFVCLMNDDKFNKTYLGE